MGEANMATQRSLEELFLVLYRRTPNETVYVIRQCLKNDPNPTARRVIRHIIPDFDEKVRKSLQDELRVAERKKSGKSRSEPAPAKK